MSASAAEHPTITLARERGWYTHPVDSPEFERCQGARTEDHDPATCDKRGKHPIGGWTRMASNDPARLARWIEEGYNLAVYAGKSGLLVLDEDTPGEMARLARDTGNDLPDTFRVTSGRGTHHYFEMPDEALGNVGSLKSRGYDIDVRGRGGYVVGPGSTHETGNLYEAIVPDAPAAPLPAWLLAQLRKRKSTRQKTEPAPPSKTSQVYWQGRTDYDTNAVNGEIARLVAMAEAATPDGEGYEGEPWDETVLAVSRRLAEFANSDWCPLTHEQASALVRQYAPIDNGFTAATVADKVRRAREWVVAERRTVPQAYLARDPAPAPSPEPTTDSAGPGRRLIARNLADIEPEPTEWAWQGVVPLGTLTGIAGTAGIGKSTVVSWLTAAFTKGTLDGDLKGVPTTVLLAAGEDDTARQLRPRLEVAGADLARVVEFVPEVRDTSGSTFETMLQIGEDLPAIRDLLMETGARVLVLDPILSFLEGNPNHQRDVRAALDPVAALARDLNVAVVVVMHFNKGSGNAGEKLSGSHVWRDTLRALLVMTIDQESERRVVTVEKMNYGPSGRSMAFAVDASPITIRGRSTTVAKATYLGESETSVQDLLDREQARRDGRRKVAEDTADAIAFVTEYGPVTTAEVYEHCGADDRQSQKNLSRKLTRAVENGHITSRGRGIYGPPDGSVPLVGSEDY